MNQERKNYEFVDKGIECSLKIPENIKKRMEHKYNIKEY